MKRSIINFLEDPTGDLPWDEDPTADDVLHVQTTQVRDRLLYKFYHARDKITKLDISKIRYTIISNLTESQSDQVANQTGASSSTVI